MNFHLESFANNVKTVKTVKLSWYTVSSLFYHMIIYSEIDKYKGVHMNASHLAVTGTLSLVPHQTDNPNMTHMMLSTMYNIEVIHYNI